MQIFFRTVPIYFWVFTVWSASKLFQYIYNNEYTVWEIIWQKILAIFDNDEFKIFVIGILAATSVLHVILVTTFSFLDFTQKPAFIRKYKVNPNTNEPPDYKQFMMTLSSSFPRNLLVIPAFIVTFYGLQWRGIPSLYPLPNILTVLVSCFMSDHLIDVGTYTIHRTLHHRLLYKRFHKMHHEYKSTIAVAIFHSHPIEHLFADLLPLAISIIIMRCHIATTLVHIMLFSTCSTINHSGYHFPFFNSPEYHDFHHVKFDCNYSGFGLMDWIFGTDKMYKDTIYQKRDRVLLSLKSAHELFPLQKYGKNEKIH